jgi:hypothetical protein
MSSLKKEIFGFGKKPVRSVKRKNTMTQFSKKAGITTNKNFTKQVLYVETNN